MKQLSGEEISDLNPCSFRVHDEHDFSGKPYKLYKDPKNSVFYIYTFVKRSMGERQKECFELEADEYKGWKKLVEDKINEMIDTQYLNVSRNFVSNL